MTITKQRIEQLRDLAQNKKVDTCLVQEWEAVAIYDLALAALERRTEERATVSPLDKVLVDTRYELTRWKMGAPPDQARLQLLIERITEQSPYRGDDGPK